MPRLARVVAVGFAHHITQRGNNRQDVFFVDDDRRVYLELLKEQAGRYRLELMGYCLMSNHVHLIAIPHAEDALAKAVGRTHFRYTQYINRTHERVGHLFQGRFKGILVEKDSYLLQLARYIVLDPVRAGLACEPAEWPWSSYRATIGKDEAVDLS